MRPQTDPAGTGTHWIRRFHPGQHHESRLVFFPHAGGSANYFFALSELLAPSTDVLAVQYPGRQNRVRERCIDDLDELARHVAAEVGPLADRPLALFGHSMGAAIAFEVARILQRHGDVVLTHLFVSGRRGPTRPRRDRQLHLGDDRALLAEMRRLSGTDAEIFQDESLLSVVMPALRADYKAIESYRYRAGPMLRCPVTALVGDADPMVPVPDAAAWQEQTSADFDLQIFPGGHFYLNEHLSGVVETVHRRLQAPLGDAAVQPSGAH